MASLGKNLLGNLNTITRLILAGRTVVWTPLICTQDNGIGLSRQCQRDPTSNDKRQQNPWRTAPRKAAKTNKMTKLIE
jgi:hypothetical protein